MSHRQIKEVIGLRYEDLPKLRDVTYDLKAMLLSHPEIDKNLSTNVNFIGFGDFSLQIQISTYTLTIDNDAFIAVKEDILYKIAEIITKHGTEMAYPYYNVDIPKSIIVKREK
jgi:MscS family membrane protein